jgi:hypothetical protein
MDVRSVDGDRHSLVHYSYKTYKKTPKDVKKGGTAKGFEADHHLTVENAHLLLMAELETKKTTAVVDKRALDKKGIETKLSDSGIHPIDNLNFYPPKASQKEKPLATPIALDRLPEGSFESGIEVDRGLSLQQYLTFIQRALSHIPNVPPQYGAKILQTAREMRLLAHWDPDQMFLRVGMGDHRHFVRAVVTMQARALAPGLVLPAPIPAVFGGYWQAQPSLPVTVPIANAPAPARVNKGEAGYNELETKYVKDYATQIMQAVTAYV